MKTVLWTDLVNRNVTGLFAVVSGPTEASPDRIPMLRELKAVEWERVADHRWIYVRWHSQNPNQEGRYDCGYSGMREDAVNEHRPTLEICDD